MAEGQTHLSRNISSKDGEPLPDPKCCCCDKRYRNPIYLPCGHTINKRCIARQKSYGSGKCVVCKESYNVKAAVKCPPNYFLERLAALARCQQFAVKLKEKKPTCEFDDHVENTYAITYCSVCKLHFCEKCKILHDKIPEALKHEVYFSETDKTEKLLNINFQFCKEHSDKKISSWCFECKLAVCVNCCNKDHEVCDISTRAQYVKKTVMKMDTDLMNYMSTIEANQNVIKENEIHFETKAKCEPEADSQIRFNVIKGKIHDIYKQCLYLQRDIQLLIKHGVDTEMASSLKHLKIQWKNIQSATEDIHYRPESSSSSERSSVLDSVSVRSTATSSLEEKTGSLLNVVLTSNPTKNSRRTAVHFRDDEDLYVNEMRYDETVVYLRNPLKEDTTIIAQKLYKFDAEFRITGMTLLANVIVVASQSAGLCAGYYYEGPGKQAWKIREKLNGPFDLDSYRSEKGKEVLFITDPGQTEGHKSAVRVYIRKKNERYTYLSCFTTECQQPKGICVFAHKVYICEPEQRQVIEYSISENFTGNVLRNYNESSVLMEPMYVAAQVINESMILIISDRHKGLKRLVIGEDSGASKFPPWAVSKENDFSPSKCSTTKRSGKSEVLVGNSSGQRINFIDFESRQVNHREYSLKDECFGPVAVAISSYDELVVACKDGTIVLYKMNEATKESEEYLYEVAS